MADTRVPCAWCKRRAIAVDRLPGLLVPHRCRSGRKGPQCQGVGKLPQARPVAVDA
jgi:hypothetical protein